MNTKKYKSEVASLGCMACHMLGYGETPASLHHVREGQGLSQRSSDWLVVPLCRLHHQGTDGIHDGRRFYLRFKLDELDLLAMTIEQVSQ